ncbi:DUF4861 family protein [Sphingomonas sp. 37zxx]|uniref:DUF4861 family protein n=1 Tax=Sphingomonas sp. 37zxx TaxID=1550073 RepID=UPI00053BEA13|nr:DUF4861 family protein [Sphingomonas sp. 37zxx]
MMVGWRVAGGAVSIALALVGGAVAARQQAAPLPLVVSPLPPPPDRNPAARVVLAEYRHDDLLWENDRTAHRIYGHALEAIEPPSGSGIDSWGKNVAWPFADRQLRTGDQHGFHGEGMDFYNVGTGRGAGGLGVWHDNKLWTSRNFVRHRVLRDGPDVADFEVDYAPWPVDVDRKVWETRRFTLPLGTHFTRMVSTLSSDRAGPLVVGIGIGKHAAGAGGQISVDARRGILSFWGPENGDHGRMAIAIRVDPAMIVDTRADADNHLVLLRVQPGRPFVYYSGSAWSLGQGGFTTRAAWDAHVAAERLDFAPPPASAR